ncbi:hypothetical protein AB0L65_25975 [Nonomuraea sp. NPDC052116]|uniref:hypothetical protein n=1 Tax=Nonomuraea sp. NPDC052116 TaxID=3155665 RepID=UPI00342C0BA5
MAITAFKFFKNLSDVPVMLWNHENKPHKYENILPGESRAIDEWVPHCHSKDRFDEDHFIEVRLIRQGGEDTILTIWQRDTGGDDRVRFAKSSEQPRWEDPGTAVPGSSEVGGNRVLFLMQDETLLVELSG